jgi:5-methylcytosine-specific restriction protein A
MLRGDKIAEIVERRFRTPLSIEKQTNNCIEIRLSDLPRNEGFVLILQKHWRRITCETRLEQFAGPLLKAIQESSLEDKKSFANLFHAFSKSSHITLLVNHFGIPINDFENGCTKITKFQILGELKNIDFSELEEEVLTQICSEVVWQILCLMMVFLQKRISDDYLSSKEGEETLKTVKEYERNPIYRDIVMALRGTACTVCEMQYEDKYGAYGKNFIEIHHLTPASTLKHGYKFNPLTDLVPVCSNCHAIIHRKKKPYTISDMRKAIKKTK